MSVNAVDAPTINQPPYEAAQENLDGLSNSIQKIHRLADRIEGQDQGKSETVPDPPVKSLQSFLNTLPGDLESLTGRLNDGIDRIENSIYS